MYDIGYLEGGRQFDHSVPLSAILASLHVDPSSLRRPQDGRQDSVWDNRFLHLSCNEIIISHKREINRLIVFPFSNLNVSANAKRCAVVVLSAIGPIGLHSAAQFPYFYMPPPPRPPRNRRDGPAGPGPKSKPPYVQTMSLAVLLISALQFSQLYVPLHAENAARDPLFGHGGIFPNLPVFQQCKHGSASVLKRNSASFFELRLCPSIWRTMFATFTETIVSFKKYP
ncbi:hypothetical protein WA026_023158 [Henosepilachna vigintioctopunctata]|uniref:Uncharacterized protein n=1 Tax=Henosepilachna vigintioctopunctata TaxID=420089 RepID=A0AAW1U0V9_9CUCU